MYLMSRSSEGVRVGIKEVAREVEANEHTTGKILQLLAKEGVIHSVKGPNGGFSIGPGKPLYFMDVVRIIDGEQFFTRCGLGLKACSERRPCPIHHQYKEVREELHRQFCTLSVQELSRDLELGKSFLK